MAWWASTGARWTVGSRRRVGVEDPVVADAAQHLAAHVGEFVADGDRVVAGVEHEQRHLAVVAEQLDEAADLLDGGGGRVAGGRDPAHVQRRGPAVGRPVELADPLVGPAGDDRLAGGVLRRRVVEAPFRAALGVAAVPRRARPRRTPAASPAGGARRATGARPVVVDAASGQRLVEAAVAAAELRLEAQRRHRVHRSRRRTRRRRRARTGRRPTGRGSVNRPARNRSERHRPLIASCQTV